MNKSQIFKDDLVSNVTQITSKPQFLKQAQFMNGHKNLIEHQITNQPEIFKRNQNNK